MKIYNLLLYVLLVIGVFLIALPLAFIYAAGVVIGEEIWKPTKR